MKTVVFLLFLISFNNVFGQWYTKKYQVSDINLLSEIQLEESLKESKYNAGVSAGIAAVGGCIVLISVYFPPEITEDSSWLERMIGENGMKSISVATGSLFLAGGIVAFNGYMIRKGKIKAAINKNFPKLGSFNVSPKIIRSNYTASYNFGVSLTYNF